ncbi:hypothetical protein, partial [Micromonospora echinofusca]|uniref:hypothetical protein n=1 Tax=Micromonospora echinofusca TaxID=47858 RepID=UPI001AD6B574
MTGHTAPGPGVALPRPGRRVHRTASVQQEGRVRATPDHRHRQYRAPGQHRVGHPQPGPAG